MLHIYGQKYLFYYFLDIYTDGLQITSGLCLNITGTRDKSIILMKFIYFRYI